MEIIFSRHAKLKIVQRKIPMRAVIAVVRYPEFRNPDTISGNNFTRNSEIFT